MSKAKARKRVMQVDIKNIQCENLNNSGIFIEFKEDNILEAVAMIIGPEGSTYENGVLFFKIMFPEFLNKERKEYLQKLLPKSSNKNYDESKYEIKNMEYYDEPSSNLKNEYMEEVNLDDGEVQCATQ